MRTRQRFPTTPPPRPAAPAGEAVLFADPRDAQLTNLLRQYFDDFKTQPIPPALEKLIEQWDGDVEGGNDIGPPRGPRRRGHRRS